MVPRREQTPIAIRSNRAAARLAILTRRTGRSQAEVIEDALDRWPDPEVPDDLDSEAAAQYARIKELLRSIPPGTFLTMKEFDALEYDEFGDLR